MLTAEVARNLWGPAVVEEGVYFSGETVEVRVSIALAVV
jgi:hypothetical protein